jgi:hypothetical protein
MNNLIVYTEKIDDLFSKQLVDWELAKANYSQIQKIKTKRLDFGGFEILVQFNPERMRSSAAKVDAKSIETRPCFLCESNRPVQQLGVTFEGKYTVLVNPFPIFERHLTIPSDVHIDQRIRPYFFTMLSLAEALPSFVVFYNGPQCGASAPDHFHFQAGNRGFLPIENDFSDGNFTRLVLSKPGIEIWHWSGYQRGILTLKGTDKELLSHTFYKFFDSFSAAQHDRPEGMINILAYHTAEGWVIHLIPRKLHRPTQFFEEGSGQILLSPASVDLGGVIITPREEDFLKISVDDVKDIFRQVCLNENDLISYLNELL